MHTRHHRSRAVRILLAAALVGASSLPTAAAPPKVSAEYVENTLRVTGPDGTKVRILDAKEDTVHKGIIRGGAIAFEDRSAVDPMLRLVEIDGHRASLATLFPSAELVAVFPKSADAGQPIVPHVRAVVRGSSDPFAGLKVAVVLTCPRGRKGRQRYELGTMVTDKDGVATVPYGAMRLPLMSPSEHCTLNAKGAGAEVRRPLTIRRGVRLVVSTDRPVYQPGHTVSIRGLVLESGSGAPATRVGSTLVELVTPVGAVIKRAKPTLSPFGVAHADLTIPKSYRFPAVQVRLTADGQKVTKRLKVGRYVTPRVLVTARSLGPMVRANEPLSVQVEVSRLDNGPVEGTPVEFRIWDSGKTLKTVTVKATAQGRALLKATVGSLKGDLVKVSVHAATPGGDVGKAEVQIPVDDGQLQVFGIPESGSFAPGLTNGVWVVALLPDGRPAATVVRVVSGAKKVSARTDDRGIAFVRFPVPSGARKVRIHAAGDGRQGTRDLTIKAKAATSLLHMHPTVASAGEVLKLRYHSAKTTSGLATFDLVQKGQALKSVSARLVNGRAEATLTVPSDLVGTVVVHAWHIDPKGRIRGDARVAMVDDGRDLTVTLTPDKSSYRPRTEARVNIKVTDRAGAPVVASLDLVAVDAGFRALGLEQPGLERAMARLTKVWNKTRLALPAWSNEALFQAADHQRLAIMAAAAEAVVPLFPKVETEAPRRQAAVSAFEPSMMKRAKAVAKALGRYYKVRKRQGKKTTLKRLAALGLVNKGQVLDPWGRRVKLKLMPDLRCANHQLMLSSSGIDGVWNNADDIRVRTAFTGYLRGLKRCKSLTSYGSGGLGMRGTGRSYSGVAYGGGLGKRPIRTKFPDTLATARNIITNAQGLASWTVTLADSLTRWVVQARGVSKSGGLGGAETELQVEQPFSVDVALPAGLTQGDVLEVPVGVTNNTKVEQAVVVNVATSAHLEGALSRRVTVKPRTSLTLNVALRAKGLGEGTITVSAEGSGSGDAVRRTLRVTPDGVPVHIVQNHRVSAGERAELAMNVPDDGLPGTTSMTLRVHPSTFSAAVDGLDALLRRPTGCFEQTSATTYPNALILDYLQRTRADKPKIASKAKAFLEAGWKRLISYEVEGGGFSWFGTAPANQVLTAFGLMEFKAMDKVMKVDRAVIARTRKWLLSKRQPDGSFAPDKSHLHDWSKVQSSNLPVTAYVAWGLARSGTSSKDLAPTLKWLKKNAHKARNGYVKALVALALSAASPEGAKAGSARARLQEASSNGPNETAFWTAGMSTGTHAKGRWADMESTGLAVLALAQGNATRGAAERGLEWLLAQRGSRGGWGTTQATVLALEGLLTVASSKPAKGTMTVNRGGKAPSSLRFEKADADVVRTVVLPAAPGPQRVPLSFEGQGDVNVQLEATRFVRPQDAPKSKSPMTLTVRPSSTSVAVGQSVRVAVDLSTTELVRMPTLQIGLPAGFDFQEASLKGTGIAHHEVLGRTLVLYLLMLDPATPLRASYELVARQVGSVSPGAAKAWPYYEPDQRLYVSQPRLTMTMARP